MASYTLKTTHLENGATKAYRPWFENGAWQGDIIEYDVASSGALSTDADVGATPASATGSNWTARATFAAKESNVTDYWDTGRKIITSAPGTDQVAFRWANLTDAQKSSLDAAADVTSTQNDLLDYIRGNHANEGTNGVRTRYSLLGDIIHPKPVYVGKPEGNFLLPDYAAFKNTARAGRIYVGANDGMIHVFDEADGSEVFAYVPSMLLSNLNKLMEDPYDHTYFADGELNIGDVYIGSSWKTIMAGGLGTGGKHS